MANALKFSYSMSLSDIDKATVSVGRRTQSLRDDIHKVMVSILYNWARAGAVNVACDKANALFEQIDENYRQAYINWFGMHAGFVYDPKEQSFSYSEEKTTINSEQFQAAKAETMFELTPPKAPQPYDLRAKVMNLISTAEKRRKKGLGEDDNVPADLVNGLKALVSDDDS